jgi:NTE family protein
MSSRALVLQGGGPLGAYEAGAFRVLHDWFSKQRSDKNFFDVIAGTSIGAINAAIIVSYVKERRKKGFGISESWKGSANKLENFWEHVSSDPQISYMWSYHWINWDKRHRTDRNNASKEAARRYYVTKELLWSGAKRVFSAPEIIYDEKFFDQSNIGHRYSNKPLQDTIQGKKDAEGFAKFPIATKVNDDEPRLLLVSVDVQEGATVAFDSYDDKDGSRVSEYGGYGTRFARGTKEEYEHAIRYDDGIMLEHVMASASVPLFYDFQRVPKKYDYTRSKRGLEQDSTSDNSRPFWDGALLSNTPLRELISEHTLFWKEKIGLEKNVVDAIWEGKKTEKVPDLDIYIVNIWPRKENDIPRDEDLTKDRMFDIIGCDKTEYDLKVATLVTDYIDLTLELIRLAKDKHIPKDDVTEILEKLAKSRFRTGKPRSYVDLLKGKFDVNEVLRIERRDDRHSISNKWADWSSMTISGLLDEGKKDTLSKLIDRLKDIVNNDSLSINVKDRLIVPLTHAKDILDHDAPSYYDDVWIQLTKFIEQVDIEGTQRRLNKEKVAMLRP